MTGPAPSVTAVSPLHALGYAHRRARVFMFWWMGMVFAIPGAVQAAILAATDQNPEDGLVLAGLGLGLSGVGWLAALGPRYTRKAPRPAEDLARTEQYIRIGPGVAISSVIGMLLIVVALMVATPKGTSPEALPVLALLAVFPVPIAVALLYSRHLHLNRDSLYADWLARR
ncbi:hypothetical protein [Arthrobacter sp. CDRTa11]|uniref:hypothetical protein n=1 Tax=Arthrobacter sp. CDRTa11 TaxID=2651199 RepID=UPI002265ED4F|nr:hypothetical protein [Arthrobacter sp. CDRTa11]